MTAELEALAVKPFYVDADGFGRYVYFARSRGQAFAKAFGDFGSLRDEATFKDFLRIARVRGCPDRSERFGEAITVCGEPAFYVDHNSQYIQFVRPHSDVILSAHPLDVEPPQARRGTPYAEPTTPRGDA